MGRSVSWETKQKLFSYEISLRNPWDIGAFPLFSQQCNVFFPWNDHLVIMAVALNCL
jgi:hypothetical protein